MHAIAKRIPPPSKQTSRDSLATELAPPPSNRARVCTVRSLGLPCSLYISFVYARRATRGHGLWWRPPCRPPFLVPGQVESRSFAFIVLTTRPYVGQDDPSGVKRRGVLAIFAWRILYYLFYCHSPWKFTFLTIYSPHGSMTDQIVVPSRYRSTAFWIIDWRCQEFWIIEWRCQALLCGPFVLLSFFAWFKIPIDFRSQSCVSTFSTKQELCVLKITW